MNIIPLSGYVAAKPLYSNKTLAEQALESKCETKFVLVSPKAGRGDTKNNNSFVRLFNIMAVAEDASDHIKSLLNKNIYCVCNENENENYVIVDKDDGSNIFILPEYSLLAEYKE